MGGLVEVTLPYVRYIVASNMQNEELVLRFFRYVSVSRGKTYTAVAGEPA